MATETSSKYFLRLAAAIQITVNNLSLLIKPFFKHFKMHSKPTNDIRYLGMKDVTYEIPFLGLYQTRNLDWIPNRKKKKKKSFENINNNNSKVSL